MGLRFLFFRSFLLNISSLELINDEYMLLFVNRVPTGPITLICFNSTPTDAIGVYCTDRSTLEFVCDKKVYHGLPSLPMLKMSSKIIVFILFLGIGAVALPAVEDFIWPVVVSEVRCGFPGFNIFIAAAYF